ncbi:MAG: hypothetical protein ACYC8T_27715 [Myxococcaceae bacterium]
MKTLAFSAIASLAIAFAAHAAAGDAGSAPTAAAAPAAGKAAPADDFVAYAEWVLDMHVTAAQRADAQALVEKALASRNAREQALIDEGVAGKADLATQSETDKQTLRPSVEDEYLKTMRRKARELPLAKWVVSIADARKPLVKGTPPLSRQSADAFAELMAFVVSEAGGKPVAADKGFRDAFAKGLAKDYPRYNDEQKAAVADLPKDWAALRAAFSAFPAEKKQKLKTEWSEALAPVLSAPKLTGDAKPLRDAAKAVAPKVSGWL